MSEALADAPKDWYPRPDDVVASGPGDDATFFLPGTTGPPPSASSGNANPSPDVPGGGGCYYYGPAADPSNPCRYIGTTGPQGGAPAPAPPAYPPPFTPPFRP
jgi:hypothetical protein